MPVSAKRPCTSDGSRAASPCTRAWYHAGYSAAAIPANAAAAAIYGGRAIRPARSASLKEEGVPWPC